MPQNQRKQHQETEQAYKDRTTADVAYKNETISFLKQTLPATASLQVLFESASILDSAGVPFAMILQTKTKEKVFFYTTAPNETKYYFVQFPTAKAGDFELPSGKLEITDVNQRVLLSRNVVDGYAVRDGDKRTTVFQSSPGDAISPTGPSILSGGDMMDPVTIYGNYGENWRSLFWLNNQNSAYSGQYTGMLYPGQSFSVGGYNYNNDPHGAGSWVNVNQQTVVNIQFVLNPNRSALAYEAGCLTLDLGNGKLRVTSRVTSYFVLAGMTMTFDVDMKTLKLDPTTFRAAQTSGVWIGSFTNLGLTSNTVDIGNGTSTFTFDVVNKGVIPQTSVSYTRSYHFKMIYNDKLKTVWFYDDTY